MTTTDNIPAADRLAFKREGMRDFVELVKARFREKPPGEEDEIANACQVIDDMAAELEREWRRKAGQVEKGQLLTA